MLDDGVIRGDAKVRYESASDSGNMEDARWNVSDEEDTPRSAENDIASPCLHLCFVECFSYPALSHTAILDQRLLSLSKARTHLAHFVLSCVDNSCHSSGVDFIVTTNWEGEKRIEREIQSFHAGVVMRLVVEARLMWEIVLDRQICQEAAEAVPHYKSPEPRHADGERNIS